MTSSGMAALMLAAQALLDPGDNLVIVAPVWPNIAAAVTIMGGEPRLVGLDPVAGGGWRLDLERLFAACDARTRGSPGAAPRPRRCAYPPACRPGRSMRPSQTWWPARPKPAR